MLITCETIEKIFQREAADYSEVLSKDMVYGYIRKAQEGSDVAMNTIIEHNIRLVCQIARKNRGRGLEFMEMVNEGVFGLVRAVEKFDLETGNCFSTYASLWVRQSIIRSIIKTGRTIRLPLHAFNDLRHVKEYIKKLERMPTPQELMKVFEFTLAHAKRILNNLDKPLSLDANDPKKGIEDKRPMIVDTTNPDEPSTFANVHELQRNDILVKELSKLDGRTRFVVEARFGMNGIKIKTLKEISNSLEVSHQRVLQLQQEGLKRLRIGLRLHGHDMAAML